MGSWPWQVFLRITAESGSSSLCGGSIISSRWILTAAHCFGENNKADSIEAYIGLHSREASHSHTRKVAIEKIIINPSYSTFEGRAYDVCLLKTTTEMSFNDHIRPVCLPPSGLEFQTGSLCIATGWGRLHFNGPLATTLHQVRVPLIEFDKCSEKYPGRLIRDSHICAGNLQDGGVDACQGDSGGPLTCLYSGSAWFQVGITSFGHGCAQSRYPGVYTRTTGIQNWIIEKTGVSPFRKVDFCDSTTEISGVSGELTFQSTREEIVECEKSVLVDDGKYIRIKILDLLPPVSNRKCISNILTISDHKGNFNDVNLFLPNRSAYMSTGNRMLIKMKVQCSPIHFRVLWEAVDDGEGYQQGNDTSSIGMLASVFWMAFQFVAVLLAHVMALLR